MAWHFVGRQPPATKGNDFLRADSGAVIEVVPVIFDACVEIVGSASVGCRVERIEYDDLVIACDQLVNDV